MSRIRRCRSESRIKLVSSGRGSNRGEAEPANSPFKLFLMLWTVCPELPFEQRRAKAAKAGYENVELVGEYNDRFEGDFKLANAARKELGV